MNENKSIIRKNILSNQEKEIRDGLFGKKKPVQKQREEKSLPKLPEASAAENAPKISPDALNSFFADL